VHERSGKSRRLLYSWHDKIEAPKQLKKQRLGRLSAEIKCQPKGEETKKKQQRVAAGGAEKETAAVKSWVHLWKLAPKMDCDASLERTM